MKTQQAMIQRTSEIPKVKQAGDRLAEIRAKFGELKNEQAVIESSIARSQDTAASVADRIAAGEDIDDAELIGARRRLGEVAEQLATYSMARDLADKKHSHLMRFEGARIAEEHTPRRKEYAARIATVLDELQSAMRDEQEFVAEVMDAIELRGLPQCLGDTFTFPGMGARESVEFIEARAAAITEYVG